jgi:hypothetical protein
MNTNIIYEEHNVKEFIFSEIMTVSKEICKFTQYSVL